jgi:hypothetical protein
VNIPLWPLRWIQSCNHTPCHPSVIDLVRISAHICNRLARYIQLVAYAANDSGSTYISSPCNPRCANQYALAVFPQTHTSEQSRELTRCDDEEQTAWKTFAPRIYSRYMLARKQLCLCELCFKHTIKIMLMNAQCKFSCVRMRVRQLVCVFICVCLVYSAGLQL